MKMGMFATVARTVAPRIEMATPTMDPKQREQFSNLLDKSVIK
jgi:hypothetical protein